MSQFPRIDRLPPYVFNTLTQLKLAARARGEDIIDFGSSITKQQGNISDPLYNRIAERYSKQDMVILIAFAGQMIATNIFNNVIETDIDEYLTEYLPSIKYS